MSSRKGKRRLRFLATLSITLVLPAVVRGQIASLYKSAASDGYPQIIQNDDYATIRFIESLYHALARVAPESSSGKDSLLCAETKEDVVTFRKTRNGKKHVTLTKKDSDTVELDGRHFRKPMTAPLCSTLLRMLHDLKKEDDCVEVRFVQFQTRAYQRRTIIDFDLEKQVIEIDCYSNGPGSKERLYTLDLVPRDKSYFWFKAPK